MHTKYTQRQCTFAYMVLLLYRIVFNQSNPPSVGPNRTSMFPINVFFVVCCFFAFLGLLFLVIDVLPQKTYIYFTARRGGMISGGKCTAISTFYEPCMHAFRLMYKAPCCCSCSDYTFVSRQKISVILLLLSDLG